MKPESKMVDGVQFEPPTTDDDDEVRCLRPVILDAVSNPESTMEQSITAQDRNT
jgi:hypothetical protein